MKRSKASRANRSIQARQHLVKQHQRFRRRNYGRPAAAHRQRTQSGSGQAESFNAPELWHDRRDTSEIRYIVQSAGRWFVHPVSVKEVQDRLALLPKQFLRDLEVIQFSQMTRKRTIFPCYGMQWGTSIYLYPIEESYVESYVNPPTPQQQIEARMYGGRWARDGGGWTLSWTRESIRDFYLNNVLIHEIGHIHDSRNTSCEARERYANWFAVEYGYRSSRGRR